MRSMFLRSAKMSVLVGVLCLFAANASAQTAISNISHNPDPAGLHEKIEIRFDLGATYSNPYDPDEIDARVEVQMPSGGSFTIPAFWYVGYTRTGGGGTENFTYNGDETWMARIAGTETGTYSYRVVIDDAAGSSISGWSTVIVNSGDDRGFIRVDSRDSRYLAFDNGTPYIPIGHNVCWGGGYRVIDWQTKMAQNGENWGRYWISMHTAGQPLEWGDDGTTWHGLGRYSQQISTRFDAMLDHAYSEGVYIQLAMDSFNAWNYDLYANWNENPYNQANGGMLAAPIDYFTNAQAKDLSRQRYRYIIARWAWNPGVLCWEFFNEADIIGSGGPSSGQFQNNLATTAAWHQEMAQYIDSIDPYDHLITTSFSNQSDTLRYPEFWSLSEMDMVQIHRYHDDTPAAHKILIDQAYAYNKPIIFGEWGEDSVPSLSKPNLKERFSPSYLPFLTDLPEEKAPVVAVPKYVDPMGQTLHDAIWGMAVLGTGAMSWWWDNWIDPANLYVVFEPLADYMQNEDWAAKDVDLGQSHTAVTSGHSVDVFGSVGWNNGYLWIRQTAGGTVTGLTLEVSGLSDTTKDVEYWDTITGSIIQTESPTASGGLMTLTVPDFTRDVAIKIIGPGGQPTPTPAPTPSPTPIAVNSLHNPGAETGDLSGWNSWEDYPYDGNGGSVSNPGHMALKLDIDTHIPTDGRFHSGSHNFGSDTGWHSARGGMYQEVTVTPGHTYRLSAWGATGPDDEELHIGWIDGTETWILNAGIPGSPQVLASMGVNRSWTQLSDIFVPTSPTITVYADWRHNWATGIGSVYVDDWELVDLSSGVPMWISY